MKQVFHSEIDETTRRLIAHYSSMSDYALEDHIEHDLTFLTGERILSDLIRFVGPTIGRVLQKIHLAKQPNNVGTVHEYPKIFNWGYLSYYAKDVQQALCKNNQLCRLISESSSVSFEQQAILISELIRQSPTLERYHYRSTPLPMAVLILKMGVDKFCACPENT